MSTNKIGSTRDFAIQFTADTSSLAAGMKQAEKRIAAIQKFRPESWYNRHVRKRRERKAAMEAASKQPMMGEGI